MNHKKIIYKKKYMEKHKKKAPGAIVNQLPRDFPDNYIYDNSLYCPDSFNPDPA